MIVSNNSIKVTSILWQSINLTTLCQLYEFFLWQVIIIRYDKNHCLNKSATLNKLLSSIIQNWTIDFFQSTTTSFTVFCVLTNFKSNIYRFFFTYLITDIYTEAGITEKIFKTLMNN